MGLKKFLKKILGTEASAPVAKEELHYKDVAVWVEKKGTYIHKDEMEVVVAITDRKKQFFQELNDNVEVLKNIDIASKKVDNRAKAIVKGNLNKYFGTIHLLKKKLDAVDDDGIERTVISMNDIIVDFYKKSHGNYQKATYLVGEEMASTNKCIQEFSVYLKKTLEDNQVTITRSIQIHNILLLLKDIEGINKIIHEIDERVAIIDKKIEKNSKEIQAKKEEIEKIKKSKEYSESLEKINEAKRAKTLVGKEIQELKEMVDFKALGRIFHASKIMITVKEHKEDFAGEFRKDMGTKLIHLLEESNLKSETITTKIDSIQKNLTMSKKRVPESKTEKIVHKRDALIQATNRLQDDHSAELKQQMKLQMSKEEIMQLLREKLERMNVLLKSVA